MMLVVAEDASNEVIILRNRFMLAMPSQRASTLLGALGT